MERRDFLRLLGMATTAVAMTGLPGPEVIQTIAAAERIHLSEADIVALELERVLPHIQKLFEQDDAFFKATGFYTESPDVVDVELFEGEEE